MDGSVRKSSRRARPFFALFSLSFFSLVAFFSRRAVPLHHVHPPRDLQSFPRADEDLPSPPIPSSNNTVPIAPAAVPSISPRPSTPSSSSLSSTSLSSTYITSSPTTSTTISTSTSSTPTPLPTLSQSHISTPTTTTLTSSTISTPASSATTPYSSISDVTPSMTFDTGLDDPSTPTIVVSSADLPSTETSPSKVTSSSRQFWDNKGAVVATFIIISLLAIAFAVLIIVTILKRRKARREALIDSEFMPQYQEPNSPVASLAPSISSTPLDPFRSRDVVHLPTDIPVSSRPTNSLGQDIPSIHLTPPSAFPGPSRYLLPSQIPTTTNAAGQSNKSEMRVSTQSGYQRSFDSFYGAYD